MKAAAPLRGTQSLVGQMGWVFERPSLTALELGWRWLFGIPFLAVCWFRVQVMFDKHELYVSGLPSIDFQNPWVASVQLAHACSLYRPVLVEAFAWLMPSAALAWVVISGLGRSLVFKRLDPMLPFRPLRMMVLQAAWLALFCATWWGWLCAMQWVASTHITTGAEPDLVGYSMWAIFLSLGFFTAWALLSWPFTIAPLIASLEDEDTALSALGQSFQLGKVFSGKLIEINLVMGIVNLALIVVAMVLSAAPLPFSDQLGPDAMYSVWAVATVFYLVASDYFQVVRLKGLLEFWKMFRGGLAEG
ncbi:MAG: hypothetical protein ABSC76_08805 [Terracidiphilus sp.]|jgi:hypothetical protein